MQKDLGMAIAKWRGELGLDRGELAVMVGMTTSAICRIELGQRMPALNRFDSFANALGKKREDLLEVIYAEN